MDYAIWFGTVIFIIIIAFLAFLALKGKTIKISVIESKDRQWAVVQAGAIEYNDHLRGKQFQPYLIAVGDKQYVGYLVDEVAHVIRDSEGKIFCKHNAPEEDGSTPVNGTYRVH